MSNPQNVYWFILHAIQIIIFQFYAATKLSELTCQLIRNRNTQVADDILNKRKVLHSKWIDYTIGTLSLGLLVIGYLKENGELYWSGKYLSLFGFLITVLAIDLFKYEKLKIIIPLETKRTASLVSRKLGNIIPRWSWVLYTLVMFVVIYFQDTQKGKIILFFELLVILVIAYFTENRSKISGQAKDDEAYRKSEMITITIIAWAIPLFIPIEKYLGHFGIDAVFSTIPLIIFIIFLNSKSYKKIMRVPIRE